MCYWNKEHADQAIAEAEKVASETGANAMPVSLLSYLTSRDIADIDSLEAKTLSLFLRYSLPIHLHRSSASWFCMGAHSMSPEL